MTVTKDRRNGLSRRTFLKGSLATAALTVGGTSFLTGCSPRMESEGAPEQSSVPEEQLFSGVCRGNCMGGCFLNVHVRDGNIVRTSMRELPDARYNRICAKGLSHVYRVYDPERVKYPMRRTGERGAGDWEQITWDEAISEIAEKFQGYAKDFGPESVSYVGGAGNDAYVSNMGRFFNGIGASNLSYPLDMAQFYAGMKTVGLGANFFGNEWTDFQNAKTMVIWGANPAVSEMQSMHFILEARDAGTKLINIDPVYSATVAKCDQWIPIVPGTDGLLAIAVMNIIVKNNWQDIEFLKKSTVAPYLVKADDGKYLRLSDVDPSVAEDKDVVLVTDGKGNFAPSAEITDPVIEGTFDYQGISVTCAYSLLLERLAQYSVDDASRICGVPVDVIEGLAEDLAVNTPSSIYFFLAIDHYVNGIYSYFDIFCIPALTGSIGKPGGFVGLPEAVFYTYANPNAKYGSDFEGAVGTKFSLPMWKLNEIVDSKSYNGQPIDLKAIYICRRNILANFCDRRHILEWLGKLDFIVVAETIMNEQARFADIVLPVCHWFEQEEVAATYPMNAFIEYQEKVMDPLFESKSDFDIFKALAEKMGLGAEFDFTPAEYIDDYFDTETGKSLGINYANLVEKKAIRALPGSVEKPYIHAEGGVFPTPTGKLQFYIESPAPMGAISPDVDLSNETLPYWEPPLEAPVEGNINEKYPLHILSDHQKLRTHSQWANVPAVLELDPEPTVKLHPDTASSRGIGEGDTVRIFNDRGHMVVKAHMSTGVRPGILLCSRGWDASQFIEGHFQDLLSREMGAVCPTQPFFDCAGDIEKVEA